MTWTCLICGDIHPLDHEGLMVAGEWMVCCGCEGKVNARRLGGPDGDPLHRWWGLSYAQYLTIPRSVMQAMSPRWKAAQATLLDILDATFEWRPTEGRYWCRLRNAHGRFVDDPLADYRHVGRDQVESILADRAQGHA